MEDKNLTLDGFTTRHIILFLLAIAGVGVSLYLTNHYFDVNFPTGLGAGSLCDINSFFNCDASTKSALSNIAGIPISVFGLLFSLCVIAGSIFPSSNFERTLHGLSYLNAAGCILLGLYTVIELQSLCPFCAGYWTISIIIAFMYHRFALPIEAPKLSTVLPLGALAVIVLGGYGWSIGEKEKKQKRMSYALANQFNNLRTVEEPDSPNKIHMSTDNFMSAPIRITKFSDFQCPACESVASTFPKLIERYKGKINIQYMFYPLDQNCNESMKRAMHPLACQAAYLSHCSKEKFHTVHDEIFANQRNLTQTWIDNKAKELGVLDCKNSETTKNFVKSQIQEGNSKYEVKSTPTLIINGKMISGGIPLNQMMMLLDYVLKNGK